MKKFSILFLLLLCISCSNDVLTSPLETNCLEVACTEVFISYTLTLKDASDAPVLLDSFEVVDKATDENITALLHQTDQQAGEYPLYNDSFVAENQNRKRTLIFKGFRDNLTVAEAEYLIETDCCHVDLTSGELELLIN